MSVYSIICKLLTIGLIIVAIAAPVLTNEPFDKPMAIAFLVCTLPWVTVGLIVDIKNSAKFEAKIKLLEDRVKELEDKIK